jgi:hypothetical protein
MDESQESPKKILTAKFFDKVAEIDQIANTALANSIDLKSELSQVQIDLKSLIESLQVNFDSGIQNVQTQINEVTNVVVQEQEIRKSETEALEQQIFAQEDQLQKDVKGKKAKTISAGSFSGNMRKKLRDTVKANPTAFGFLAGGMALTSLAGVFPQSADATGDKTGDKTDDKTGDGTGLIEENVGDNAFGFGNPFDTDLGIGDDAFGFGNPFDTDLGIGDDAFGFGSFDTDLGIGDDAFGFGSFDTDLGIGDDAFGFGSFDTTEIIKNVTDEKNNNEKSDVSGEQKLLLTLEERRNEIDDEIKLNKELLLEKDVSSITAERKTIEEAINNLKLNKKDNEFGGNDYLQKLIKDKTSIKPILNNISNIGDGGLFDDIVNSKEDNLNVGDMGFGFSNFDTDIFKIKDDNTSNNFIDGGTTVIEGTTEVVDGGTDVINQRGEVRASTSLVKSTNSPVTAVKLSENNSIREFVVG